MKQTSTLLLTSFASLISLSTLGQAFPEAAVTKLKDLSEKQSVKDRDNYAIALEMASKKNWPLVIEGRGKMARLVGVDAFGFPMYFETTTNKAAAATIGANKLWIGSSSGLNLSGNQTNLKDRLAIWDGSGILATHQELVGRITARDAQSSIEAHSTHVAGTMIASGINPLARGMAYGLPGMLSYTFDNHLSEMSAAASTLLSSNHSYATIAGWRYNSGQSRWEFYGAWGENEDFKFGYYDAQAQLWDSIAMLAPNYLIVNAASNNRNETGPAVGANYWRLNANGSLVSAGVRPDGISSQDGYDQIPTYGTSKNILTVGNILPIPAGYSKPSDVVLNSSSSVGPTDDGRIKPDIVANGTNVTSTFSSSNTAYITYSGTSMAPPTIAGSVMLLQELWMRKNSNIPAWSSTLRGLIIHTAEEATGIPGPDYMHGWGLANIEKAAQAIDKPSENLIQQRTLTNGSTYTFNVVASGKGPLKVSICWTDPPGTVITGQPLNNRSRKLVHDLDLRVKKGGQVHQPWKLDVSLPSLPASRGDNDVDNIEVVEVDSTIVGETYTIEVTHKGSLTRAGVQTFSLIATSVGGTSYEASTPSSSAGSRIDSLSIGKLTNQNTTGCKTYSDFRQITGNVEVGSSNAFYLKTNSCDASDAGRFAKVYIDFNSDGDFLDADELVATSPSITNNGIFSGTISIPNTIPIGRILVMRVILSETSAAANIVPNATYTRGETQDYQLLISTPSNDASAGVVEYPENGECANPSKYVTVSIRNTGSVSKNRIPVEVEVRNGTTLLATLRDTCKLTIAGGKESLFTLQTPFKMEAGKTYDLLTRLNMPGDQLPANNEFTTQVVATATGAAPTNISSVVCNGQEVILKGTVDGNADSRITWYTSPTALVPFATSPSGTQVSTPTITPDRKYYASSNEFSGKAGLTTKMDYPSGGYNEFNGNFVRFSTTTPILIESVRMYTSNPGNINIINADLAQEPNDQGQYSYYNRGSLKFPVTNSRPIAQSGALTENNANDPGLVYNLNFAVVEPGNHILIMQATDGASVFRNNNIPLPGPYPQKLNGGSDAFAINGNGVTAPNDPNNFYYFYYDIKVSPLAACPSPRVAITAPNNVIPSINQNGNVLTSSSTNNNQWRLNGADITGANNQQYTANVNGLYRVAVTDELGCVSLSNELNVVLTSINNIDPATIGLSLSPNPHQGMFHLRFRVSGREDLQVAVLDITGRQVYQKAYRRFSGSFEETIQLQEVPRGVYLLRIIHGNDCYLRKMLID